jgi:hypothetical protein
MIAGAAGAYLSTSGWVPNEKLPVTCTCTYDGNIAPPAPTANSSGSGQAGQSSPPERSFIYLDVGRWGGGTSKATSGQGKPGGFFYGANRDFGLVCGRTAVLCAFFGGNTPPGMPGPVSSSADPLTVPTAASATQNAVSSAPSGDLAALNGLLKFLATALPNLGAPTVRRWDVAGAQGSAASDTIRVIVGDMHLPTITIPKQHTFGERCGRLPGNDSTTGSVAGKSPKSNGIPLMVDLDAATWFTSYTGCNSDSDRSAQGADIYEDAGNDLIEFVTALEQYKGPGTLHLMQLGDMIDLWMGLDRFYMAPAATVTLITTSGVDGTYFVDHWTDQALNNTGPAGQSAIRFLKFAGPKSFLYGNHDCYYSAHQPDTLNIAGDGSNQRRAFFNGGNVYAEHGHQWDSSNKDGASFGHDVTQQVFVHTILRKADPQARYGSMKGAASYFISAEAAATPFMVYAMGHTHCAALIKVIIDQPQPQTLPKVSPGGGVDGPPDE